MDKKVIKEVIEENPKLDPTHELDQMEILLDAEDKTGEKYELTETTKINIEETGELLKKKITLKTVNDLKGDIDRLIEDKELVKRVHDELDKLEVQTEDEE